MALELSCDVESFGMTFDESVFEESVATESFLPVSGAGYNAAVVVGQKNAFRETKFNWNTKPIERLLRFP